MKYLCTFLILTLMVCSTKAIAGSTQSNVSGSNTAIEGGYESSTTYESGSESSSTTSNATTSNIRSSPPTAGAPSYNSMTQDVCAVGASAGLQTFGVGISGGKHFIDVMNFIFIANDMWMLWTAFVLGGAFIWKIKK